jgi:hypothetical protein
MKRQTTFLTPEEEKEHLDRIVEELGADVVRKLHRAYELTVAAVYKRSVQAAEAKLRKRQH